MRLNIKLLIPLIVRIMSSRKELTVVLHYVGFSCFDVFLQNCTKGRYTPMSFGFNVRCCTVVESYIVYVSYTNIELFRDGHYLCRGRG